MTAKLNSAYNSLIIAHRVLRSETILLKIIGWESCEVVRFDLGPILLGHMRVAKLKSAYNPLIIGLRVLGCETNL